MALMETPTDSYGMPLLVLPPQDSWRRSKTNKHHLWHPDVELSSDSDADRALRYSIVQRLPKFVHFRYHKQYGGPKLPITNADKFFLTILGRAGYRSQEVLNFSGQGPDRLPFKQNYIRQIHIFPDQARIGEDGQDYRRRRTGMFLAAYALEQDIGHLSEIDEFLHTPYEDRRLELGQLIIEEGIRVAVDPIVKRYDEAISEHRIGKGSRGGPFQVVTRIFTPGLMPDYIDSLAQKLAA